MKFDYTTRLDSSMNQTTLNATVLAMMAELCAAVDAGSKPDHVNLHPMARLYSGQLGTIDGDRLALAADGFGVPTEAIKNGAVTATPMASASVSRRAVLTEMGSRGVRGMMAGVKTGILRGHTYVAVVNTASTGTVTIDWTNAGSAQTDADEAIPAGWTTPLSLERVVAWPAVVTADSLDADFASWKRPATPGAGHTCIANLWISGAPGDGGFTAKVQDYDWDETAHTSAAMTTGLRHFYFSWIAVVKHS